MEEKILTTDEIYVGRVIRLQVHQVELPDGKQAKREIMYHPGAVAIVAIDADNQVLMVEQYRTAARQILLEIPAGTLEAGESPETCAIRELREETGYQPTQIQPLGGIFVAPSYTTEYIHLFYTSQFIHAPLTGDSDEFIRVHRVPLSEVLAMIADGRVQDAKSISGLLKAVRLYHANIK